MFHGRTPKTTQTHEKDGQCHQSDDADEVNCPVPPASESISEQTVEVERL